MTDLRLSFDLKFYELYEHAGLCKIDQHFLSFLKERDDNLHAKLTSMRVGLAVDDYSKTIIELAPYVEEFIAVLFGIPNQAKDLERFHKNLENIYKCKRLFVQRKAAREYANEDWSKFDHDAVYKRLITLLKDKFDQLTFANQIMYWLADEEKFAEQLELAKKYAAWAALSSEGKETYEHWVLFKLPKKKNHDNLIDITTNNISRIKQDKEEGAKCMNTPERRTDNVMVKSWNWYKKIKSRDGFSLTDEGADLALALDQANYCIFCHNQHKDSCSKGLNETNKGCPLEEKISEMNYIKSQGFSIASLATAVIDNPMVAATGHRICNECMKACIYQKQDPVNIPQIETRVLKDVLQLPWGFEIYSLLTRWNPLNLENPICKENSGYKVLVAGLGPAGFTLAHYLLNEGHTVVGIDGLKIEPLPEEISGVNKYGERVPFKPIKDIEKLFEDLDTRIPYGFGGVAEYGITVRWNKNFLKIIRLLLERRKNFKMYGGVRFGSQIDYNNALNELGFDHIALALGAGKPNLLDDIPNGVAQGIRAASDFLMSLQLTGAAKKNSLANLQVRLPIAVIGGGLTAIDTATEAIAYYIRQVDKFRERHSSLISLYSKYEIERNWSNLDQEVADEFLKHAKLFDQERRLAKAENRAPDFVKIIRKLGGVKVFYRKKLTESPSYRLNHEEVEFAFQEGIEFIENAVPKAAILDSNNCLKSINFTIDGVEQSIDIKTALVAIGTNPNTVLHREDPENFELDGKYLKCNQSISTWGDLHPSYNGNVVKAMASAKDGYKNVTKILLQKNPTIHNEQEFFAKLNELLIATIYKVIQLTPTIVEVIVKSPLAARKFHPGQFYRLQNYEATSAIPMEGLALTGASVDKGSGLISLIVLEMGGASSLCRYLKDNEPVILMGPTGSPTEIKPNETVVLVGGGLGNAVLFSIGDAIKRAGGRVIYFAGYKKKIDRYKTAEICAAAHQVIWCCDEDLLEKISADDLSFHGNIVDAIQNYAEKKLGGERFDLSKIDRIIAIGSDSMMNAVNEARRHKLKGCLPANHQAIASINSPMQCMMKEICAQCLQKHVDPDTGLETYVYSCANQDQDMDRVDFTHLKNRLAQNSLSEKLSAKWLQHCLEKAPIES